MKEIKNTMAVNKKEKFILGEPGIGVEYKIDQGIYEVNRFGFSIWDGKSNLADTIEKMFEYCKLSDETKQYIDTYIVNSIKNIYEDKFFTRKIDRQSEPEKYLPGFGYEIVSIFEHIEECRRLKRNNSKYVWTIKTDKFYEFTIAFINYIDDKIIIIRY